MVQEFVTMCWGWLWGHRHSSMRMPVPRRARRVGAALPVVVGSPHPAASVSQPLRSTYVGEASRASLQTLDKDPEGFVVATFRTSVRMLSSLLSHQTRRGR